MRYMGIDYGTKRVGVAFTDEEGMMAFPHGVVSNTNTLVKELAALIEERDVQAIVIGHSLDTENNANKVQGEIESLVQDLTLEVGLPIHLEPEQYTTQEAIRIQGRTKDTDASAAAIILNSYLSKQKV